MGGRPAWVAETASIASSESRHTDENVGHKKTRIERAKEGFLRLLQNEFFDLFLYCIFLGLLAWGEWRACWYSAVACFFV